MTPVFSIGDWVIDPKREIAPTVFAIIEGLEIVYILEDDNGSLYMEKESALIKYDKYWFDKMRDSDF